MRADPIEPYRATMVAIVEDHDDPVEPWDLCHEAVDRMDRSVTVTEARYALQQLTHGPRSERSLIHTLDGRITIPSATSKNERE